MKSNGIDIDTLKKSEGHCDCTVEQLKAIYIELDRPKARVVKLYKDYYVSLEPIYKVQFKVIGSIRKEHLSFIERKVEIDATKDEQNIVRFLVNEFVQGGKLRNKLLRAVETAIPLGLLNLGIRFYATNNSMSNLFLGLLTAVSVFVAIFSLFTISHEHLERRKLRLFETGKLAYYFSVDKNIALLGICSLMSSIFALLIVNGNPKMFWNTNDALQKYLILLLINLSFLATFIVLRSIIEFYIHRPARFMLGDMKKEYLEKFDEVGHEEHGDH